MDAIHVGVEYYNNHAAKPSIHTISVSITSSYIMVFVANYCILVQS